MLYPCNCKNSFQDKEYGKGIRVWNPTKEGRRCTVCSTAVKDEKIAAKAAKVGGKNGKLDKKNAA